jgi:hypothetical protein
MSPATKKTEEDSPKTQRKAINIRDRKMDRRSQYTTQKEKSKQKGKSFR